MLLALHTNGHEMDTDARDHSKAKDGKYRPVIHWSQLGISLCKLQGAEALATGEINSQVADVQTRPRSRRDND
jgi:hypothetical protein